MFVTEEDLQRADWPFLKGGATTLFWRRAHFATAKETLQRLGYEIADLDCGCEEAFNLSVTTALRWRDQFGYEPWTGNLDALNDGLHSFPSVERKNLVLGLEGFHRLVANDAHWAAGLLDVFERNSHVWLLRECCLIILVQTDDAGFEAPDLGGRSARWNNAEWFRKDRGLA